MSREGEQTLKRRRGADGTLMVKEDIIDSLRDDVTDLRERVGLLEQSVLAVSTTITTLNTASSVRHSAVLEGQVLLLKAVRGLIESHKSPCEPVQPFSNHINPHPLKGSLGTPQAGIVSTSNHAASIMNAERNNAFACSQALGHVASGQDLNANCNFVNPSLSAAGVISKAPSATTATSAPHQSSAPSIYNADTSTGFSKISSCAGLKDMVFCSSHGKEPNDTTVHCQTTNNTDKHGTCGTLPTDFSVRSFGNDKGLASTSSFTGFSNSPSTRSLFGTAPHQEPTPFSPFSFGALPRSRNITTSTGDGNSNTIVPQNLDLPRVHLSQPPTITLSNTIPQPIPSTAQRNVPHPRTQNQTSFKAFFDRLSSSSLPSQAQGQPQESLSGNSSFKFGQNFTATTTKPTSTAPAPFSFNSTRSNLSESAPPPAPPLTNHSVAPDTRSKSSPPADALDASSRATTPMPSSLKPAVSFPSTGPDSSCPP